MDRNISTASNCKRHENRAFRWSALLNDYVQVNIHRTHRQKTRQSQWIWSFLGIVTIFGGVFVGISGCKSPETGKTSFPPFFGSSSSQVPSPPTGAINANQQIIVPSQPPQGTASTAPVYVQNSPGPVSQSATGAYTPPDGLSSSAPATTAPAATSSPVTTYMPNSAGMTIAYEAPHGANVNAGVPVGEIPASYTTSHYSNSNAANTATQPPYQTQFQNSVPPVQTQNNAIPAVQPAHASPAATQVYDPSAGAASVSPGVTPSTYRSPYNHGQSSSIVPTRSIDSTDDHDATMPTLNNGYYTATDGTHMRVINGQAFVLTQYMQYETTAPTSAPSSRGNPASNWQPNSGGTSTEYIDQSSVIVPTQQSHLSATQMTDALGKVPVTPYSTLLGDQQGNLQDLGHGYVTIRSEQEIQIVPDVPEQEVVPSLDLSQITNVGAISATAQEQRNDRLADQLSIWDMLATQNNEHLLYGGSSLNASLATSSVTNNQPQYIAMGNTTVPLANGFSQSVISNQTIAPSEVANSSSQILMQSAPAVFSNAPTTVLGQSPCPPCYNQRIIYYCWR